MAKRKKPSVGKRVGRLADGPRASHPRRAHRPRPRDGRIGPGPEMDVEVLKQLGASGPATLTLPVEGINRIEVEPPRVPIGNGARRRCP